MTAAFAAAGLWQPVAACGHNMETMVSTGEQHELAMLALQFVCRCRLRCSELRLRGLLQKTRAWYKGYSLQ